MLTNNNRVRAGCVFAVIGGVLISIVSVYMSIDVLSALGYHSVFLELDLSSSMKVFISLYMFLGASSGTLAFIGSYLLWKRHDRLSLLCNIIGGSSALAILAVQQAHNYFFPTVLTWNLLAGAGLMALAAIFALTIPSTTKPRVPFLSTIEAAMIAVFSAMYAMAILMITIPSPTGGYTHIGDVVVFTAALLFGPRVGGLVGILGAVVADLYTGYSRWFISILAHGLEGFIAGLAKGKPLLLQVVACVIGGVVMASVYFIVNIFIKGLPLATMSYARDLFAQAGVSIVVAIVLTKIIKRMLPQIQVRTR